MGRGKKNNKRTARATEMTYTGIQKVKGRFSNVGATTWRTPNRVYVVDAEAFTTPDQEHIDVGGLPLDRAVALRLLKFSFNLSPDKPDFWAHHRWFYPLDEHRFFEVGSQQRELDKLITERELLVSEYHRLHGDKYYGPLSEEDRKDLGLSLDEVVERGQPIRARIDELSASLEYFYESAPLLHPEDTVPGMMAAGRRLSKAIDDKELIAVWCDYDVDGLTAGEVLRRALAPYDADFFYGWADAKAGFGVSSGFVREAAERGAKLFVTLDCGSGAAEQVRLAQDLGMEVIVVDHHSAAEEAEGNTANHHLNPKLFDPVTSLHTGAQLAWKLGAAAQIVREGQTRDDLWKEPLYLAGMGCIADMGSVILHENRAFYWLANEHAPIGVRKLAKALGEETDVPGQMILTQACLNLAKRTPLAQTSDVGALLAARTAKEAAPYVKKLSKLYLNAQVARKEMIDLALEQTGQAERDWATGKIDRPDPDVPLAIAMIDDDVHGVFIGYTGPVASSVSRGTGKPAFIFIRNGDDVKFSGRNDSAVPVQLGDLIEDPALKLACTVETIDEDGATSEMVNLGGHPAVVSGRCKPENIDAVKAALNDWAGRQKVWFPAEEKTPSQPFVQEKLVPPERLAAIEEQSRRIGPFSNQSQPIFFLPGQESTMGWNDEVKITIAGELRDMMPLTENDKYLAGSLVLANGETREVCYPADVSLPEGPVQWLLRIGKSGPYYLRHYAELPPDQESQWHKPVT